MSEKTMLQICIPFLTAVAVIIVFYVLGFILGGLILGLIFDCGDGVSDFFFLFSEDASTAGWVVGGILWVIITVWAEMLASEE